MRTGNGVLRVGHDEGYGDDDGDGHGNEVLTAAAR